MARRLLPFVALVICAGMLISAYMIVLGSTAAALPVAASKNTYRPPAAKEASNSAPLPRPTTMFPLDRAPVPLLVSRHATYFVDAPQQPAPEKSSPTELQNKEPSNAEAKAMIEADGYKSVKALVKAPDGAWHGLAMRGTIEVAISVDTAGNVSAQ